MKTFEIIVGITVGAAAIPAMCGAQDVYPPSQIDTSVTLERHATVDLSLISGRIRVTGWDRQNIKISASAQRGRLSFRATPSRLWVSVEGWRGRAGDASYEVSVPRGTRLVLEAISGDLTASGTRGEVSASTVSGDVEVADAVQEVSAESVSGSIHVTGVTGSLDAKTVSGQLRVENVSGNVDAGSVSGRVALEEIRSAHVRSETVSGNIYFAGGMTSGGKYVFESHSGTIRLTVPQNTGAAFSVKTFSGTIDSDIPVTMQPAQRGRRDERFEFTIGDGGARAIAGTFSGRIIINRVGDANNRRND